VQVQGEDRRLKVIPLMVGERASELKYLECNVIRSRRKTLAIHIKHRNVEVRSPMWASRREITYFLEQNKQWIAQQLREESRRYRESLRIEKGRKIFFRARERIICFQESSKQKITVTRDKFIIQGPDLNAPRAHAQVEKFLQEKAQEYLPDRARALARYLRVNSRLKEVKLRKTKSKWGHCTSTGVVQFNWLIMLAPDSIIDYMITHEICHLVHMNHSAKFWNMVGSVCPDYEYYRDWLSAHEHRLWL